MKYKKTKLDFVSWELIIYIACLFAIMLLYKFLWSQSTISNSAALIIGVCANYISKYCGAFLSQKKTKEMTILETKNYLQHFLNETSLSDTARKNKTIDWNGLIRKLNKLKLVLSANELEKIDNILDDIQTNIKNRIKNFQQLTAPNISSLKNLYDELKNDHEKNRNRRCFCKAFETQ